MGILDMDMVPSADWERVALYWLDPVQLDGSVPTQGEPLLMYRMEVSERTGCMIHQKRTMLCIGSIGHSILLHVWN